MSFLFDPEVIIKLFAMTPRESIMICGSAIGPPA